MRIALCQIPVSSDVSVNLSRVRTALKEAAAGTAELAVFPEAMMVRFGSDLKAAAEPLDGPFGTAVSEACAETEVAAVLGVFEPSADGRVYNTAVAYSAGGALVASYRKLHLFDALGQRESDLVAPGSAPVITELAGVPVGLQVCYDIRFPELTRTLAVGGAKVVTVSAAWQAGPFKEEHWVTLLRARAIENTVWIAAVDQVPDLGEKPTRAPTGTGRSMLIDPLGVVRTDLGPASGVSVVNADLALLDSVRADLPSLANRRDDIFARLPARSSRPYPRRLRALTRYPQYSNPYPRVDGTFVRLWAYRCAIDAGSIRLRVTIRGLPGTGRSSARWASARPC